jgi:hypothetical protein
MSAHSPEDLQRMYGPRFGPRSDYRKEVWSVLVDDWFGKYIRTTDAVLDLGCGYGEFINTIRCREKFAMDLNPDAPGFLAKKGRFWPRIVRRAGFSRTARSTSCSRAISSSTCRTKSRWGEPWTIYRCLRPGRSRRGDGAEHQVSVGVVLGFLGSLHSTDRGLAQGSARRPRFHR